MGKLVNPEESLGVPKDNMLVFVNNLFQLPWLFQNISISRGRKTARPEESLEVPPHNVLLSCPLLNRDP